MPFVDSPVIDDGSVGDPCRFEGALGRHDGAGQRARIASAKGESMRCKYLTRFDRLHDASLRQGNIAPS